MESVLGMNYEYKETKRKYKLCVSIRDRGENSLLEVEIKGNNVKIVTNVRNEKTTHFEICNNC